MKWEEVKNLTLFLGLIVYHALAMLLTCEEPKRFADSVCRRQTANRPGFFSLDKYLKLSGLMMIVIVMSDE